MGDSTQHYQQIQWVIVGDNAINNEIPLARVQLFMKTLVAHDGRTATLSDEVYQVTGHEKDHPQPFGYGVGSCVRLISGIDGSTTPGYHFNNEYRTVCSITATTAEFVGIRREHLKDISNRPIKE